MRLECVDTSFKAVDWLRGLEGNGRVNLYSQRARTAKGRAPTMPACFFTPFDVPDDISPSPTILLDTVNLRYTSREPHPP
jgi:hypothetical protein